MLKQLTVAAIHDLSGMGKCSLTAAIPVLSAAGVSVSSLPTAVLSTQTGGLSGYTYRDLTSDMVPIINHWKTLNADFDAVYSGFLGAREQVDIVIDFLSHFKSESTLYLCDPAMADNGSLYETFDNDFVDTMKKLCSCADIIVPNITEAALLLDMNYSAPPYTIEYVNGLIKELAEKFNVKYVVLTGVDFDINKIGAATYDSNSGNISYSLRQRVDGMFHSTGDLFASALLGGILNGLTVEKAAQTAIDFTVNAINKTVEIGGDSRFGLCFEKCLPLFMKDLGLF